jgi:hypothetical protein
MRSATNLGLARDWHYLMRKSGKPDLRAVPLGACGPSFETRSLRERSSG